MTQVKGVGDVMVDIGDPLVGKSGSQISLMWNFVMLLDLQYKVQLTLKSFAELMREENISQFAIRVGIGGPVLRLAVEIIKVYIPSSMG